MRSLRSCQLISRLQLPLGPGTHFLPHETSNQHQVKQCIGILLTRSVTNDVNGANSHGLCSGTESTKAQNVDGSLNLCERFVVRGSESPFIL